jgi:hypothetical protein
MNYVDVPLTKTEQIRWQENTVNRISYYFTNFPHCKNHWFVGIKNENYQYNLAYKLLVNGMDNTEALQLQTS